jgi:hypothetical protein
MENQSGQSSQGNQSQQSQQSQALVIRKGEGLIKPVPEPSTSNVIYTIEQLKNRAEVYIQSGLLPKDVKTWQTAVVLMDMAQALGIKIQFAGKFFNIIQGQPTLSPKGMMAVIFQSGLLTKYEYKDNGECAFITLGRRQPHNQPPLEFTGTFSMEDALRMMTTEWVNGNKQTVPLSQKFNWKSMPRVMRKWRALSEAANWLYSDIIGGMHTPEEIENSIDIRDTDFSDYDLAAASSGAGNNAGSTSSSGHSTPSPNVISMPGSSKKDLPVIEAEVVKEEPPNPALKGKVINNINRLIIGIESHKGVTTYATTKLEDLSLKELETIQKELINHTGKTLAAFLADLWTQEVGLKGQVPQVDVDKYTECTKHPAKSLKELKELIEASQLRVTALCNKVADAVEEAFADDDVPNF